MTKRSKKLLFYSAILIFIILSYIVILYAQGYKYSLSEGRFQLTGTVAIKSNTSAKIFIDDTPAGNTSFFNNSFSVDSLLPGKYTLSLDKDGFSSWTKIVTIEEGLVTDFPNILLLPETGQAEQDLFDEVSKLFQVLQEDLNNSKANASIKKSPTPTPTPENESFLLDKKTAILYQIQNLEPQKVADGVVGFNLSENKNKIAWWNKNEIWVRWLSDQNYQPFHKSGETEIITRFQIPIQNALWFRGEDHLVIELEKLDAKKRPYSVYRVIEIDKRGGINIIEL